MQGQQTVQQQLQQMLLARLQAYQASGLTGITPYDRGGSSIDVGRRMLKASNAVTEFQKYMPGFSAGADGLPTRESQNRASE